MPIVNKKTKKQLASQKETELIGDRKDCSNEAIEWNLGPNLAAMDCPCTCSLSVSRVLVPVGMWQINHCYYVMIHIIAKYKTLHLLLLLGIVCFVWLLGVSAVAALLSSSLSLVCIRENCVLYGPCVANSFT